MIEIETLIKLINEYKRKSYEGKLNANEEITYNCLQDLLIYKVGEQKGMIVSCECRGCINNKEDNEDNECIHCQRAYSDCYEGNSVGNIAQLKATLKGNFADVEVYVVDNSKIFRGKIVRKYPVSPEEEITMKVLEYTLADEECYRRYISDSQAPVDFQDWFHDKNAKVLCILAK